MGVKQGLNVYKDFGGSPALTFRVKGYPPKKVIMVSY